MKDDFHKGDRVILFDGSEASDFTGEWNEDGLMDDWVGHIAVISCEVSTSDGIGFRVKLETPREVYGDDVTNPRIERGWIWDPRYMERVEKDTQTVSDEDFSSIFE